MWILFAFGSALFAGITSILAKCGIKDTDSDIVTALRTIVVLIFSWIMVLLTGSSCQRYRVWDNAVFVLVRPGHRGLVVVLF